nr:hypothetical protein [Tanacetum cinerariifolium]
MVQSSQRYSRRCTSNTPINDNNPFVAPPSSEALIEYVNTLGYPVTLKNVSTMSVNDLYQPWRAILSIINMCLTGKTARHDRPRHPVLKILWGIIHRSNIDYDNVLGNLRFVGNHSREVFGMLIPDALLTDAITRAAYYGGYLAHITKYQQYLDGEHSTTEEGAVPESHAFEATKKRKLVKLTPDEPSPAKRSKAGLVGKRRKPKNPLKLVDEFANEGVPIAVPRLDDEESDLQRGIELSLKDLESRNQGHAHPVVFIKPDSGRFQPLPERRSPTTTGPSGNAESPSLDAELADSETEFDKTVTPINKEKDASNRELTEINAGVQNEGQAGSNPGKQDEG